MVTINDERRLDHPPAHHRAPDSSSEVKRPLPRARPPSYLRLRLGRIPLVLMGMIALAAGVWGGLLRLPLALPLLVEHANWITFHGPLMVCGFLGTVIALERAVGLQSWWTYAAPLVTGAGGLVLLSGHLGPEGPLLLTAGSGLFTLLALRVVQLQPALFTVTMALAALAWGVGNVAWLRGAALPQVVPWWMAFLGLTIAGERLDLSRFQRPSPWARPLFVGTLLLLSTGLVSALAAPSTGERVAAVAWLLLAAWLARFDIARRTVRQPGLPRFMAICLLSGYVWLGLAGVLLFAAAPLSSGVRYDAALHSFFLGFVFSMIFGHAPVIFPSILHLGTAYRPRFYAHLGLLHLSLLLRVTGDLSGWAAGRQWGAILNGIAILVFLANTVTALLQVARASRSRTARGA